MNQNPRPPAGRAPLRGAACRRNGDAIEDMTPDDRFRRYQDLQRYVGWTDHLR